MILLTRAPNLRAHSAGTGKPWFRRLAIRAHSAHIDEMTSQSDVRLLDVDVTVLEPTLWKWTVSEKCIEVSHGYATSRETAQLDGNTALFKLLSSSLE